MVGTKEDKFSSTAINLQRLLIYRCLMLAALLLGVLAAIYAEVGLPLLPIMGVITLFVVVNAGTWWRLRRRGRPVGEWELLLHLIGDVLILAAVLYASGGSTNPFVSLLLVPLALAAAALTARFTWAIAAAALLCYSLLMVWYIPLPHPHGINFNLHVLGMWFGFVLSALLISYFAVKMSATLREREQALAQAREDALRDERLVALGTLAAGAAHELGTPLATMAILVKEMETECAATPGLAGSLPLLRDQIVRCKGILAQLAAAAGQTRAEAGCVHALDGYLEQLTTQWHTTRPGVGLRRQWQGTLPPPRIIVDQTLTQALTNILSNAADASEQTVEVNGRWSERALWLEICDRGAGVSAEVAAHTGEPFFTTKPPGRGLGLGLFLAQATIKRLGGKVHLSNRAEGGACVRVELPLAELSVHHE